MTARNQLRLVSDPPPVALAGSSDATRVIFEHWVALMGRSLARCKLGPPRRTAINAALAMGYGMDALLLAIEGMAADPLDDVASDKMAGAMREIEWLLAREARIERWAERGEQLRALADRPPSAPSMPDGAPSPSAEDMLARRGRMADLAARMRAGAAT